MIQNMVMNVAQGNRSLPSFLLDQKQVIRVNLNSTIAAPNGLEMLLQACLQICESWGFILALACKEWVYTTFQNTYSLGG